MRRAAAALVVVALGVAGVALAQVARRHVRPHAQLVSAAVSGASVGFSLRVSFSAPTGIRGASPCHGRVVARAGGRRWARRLGPAVAGCAAVLPGHLPAALSGRRVSFRIHFAGNRAVAPFDVRRRLLLLAPPVRPLPTPPAP